MSARNEMRLFYGVIGLISCIPLVAGLTTAFGGLEGMASLFGVDDEPLVVSSLLRNNVRAISLMFFAWLPLIVWTLQDLSGRAGAFRITFGCAFLAGFARLAGWLIDGYPGVLPVVFTLMELVLMPVLLLWHARQVRLAREQGAAPSPAVGQLRA